MKNIPILSKMQWITQIYFALMLCTTALFLPGVAKRALAADFTISGTVFNDAKQPLANIEVAAIRILDPNVATDRVQVVVTTATGADGSYLLSVPDRGPFRVRFSDQLSPHIYQTTYFKESINPFYAQEITLGETGQVTDINAFLAPHVDLTINGHVTDESGNALENIQVSAYQLSGNPATELPRYVAVASTNTDSNGVYTLTTPHTGPFHVGFADLRNPLQYHTEYYDNASLAYGGTNVEFVDSAAINNIDAQLSAASVLTGTILDSKGQPVARADVTAYQPVDDGSGGTTWQFFNQVDVDPNGQYTMTLPYSGTVRVQFGDQVWPPRFAFDYYDNAQSVETASDVSVSIGSITSNIDGHVEFFGTVSGRVTDKNGNPIQNVTIGGYQFITDTGTWLNMGSGLTDVDGVYTMPVSLPGVTHVCFDTQFNQSHFAPRCYGSDLADPAQATDILVQTGAQTTGIDIQLKSFPLLFGRVTDMVGNPLETTTIIFNLGVIDQNGNFGSAGFLQAFADSEGNYEIWNHSEFRHGILSANYSDGFESVTEWYKHANSFQSATPLTMELDSETQINFQLAVGGSIAGQVTNELTGEALSGIPVVLYHLAGEGEPASWVEVKRRNSDSNGRYSLNFLPPDSYRIGFEGGIDYRSEFYSDTLTINAAQDLVITETLKLGTINAQLTPTPHLIGGRVTTQDGSPISNITVSLFQPSGNSDGAWFPSLLSTVTNEQGDYQFPALPPNLYKVQFVDVGQAYYATEYYSNVRTIEAADVITIAPGSVITNVDAQLEVGEAEIVIAVDVIPDSRQNFRFSSTLGDFRMDDAGLEDGDSYTNTVTFLVARGTYTFGLQMPVEFFMNSWSCSKDSLGWNGYDDGNITLQVFSGEKAYCHYMIQRTVDVEAISYHDANGNGMQDEGETVLAGWPVVLYSGAPISESATNLNGVAVFNNLRPISYLVCQRVPAGWSNTQPGDLIESLGMPCHYAELTPAQKVVARFGNIESNDPDFRNQPSTSPDSIMISGLEDVTEDDEGYGDTPNENVYLPLVSR